MRALDLVEGDFLQSCPRALDYCYTSGGNNLAVVGRDDLGSFRAIARGCESVKNRAGEKVSSCTPHDDTLKPLAYAKLLHET